MLSSIEVITTPTSDTPGTALILSFSDKRYLIGNIHEGLTRALIERGTKIVKVTDIFITGRTEWKSIGGLLGTILSAADTRTSSVASAAAIAEGKAASLRAKGITKESNYQRGHHEMMRKHAFVNHRTEGQDGKIGDGSATLRLSIHGGPNITHSLAAARNFIFRKGMPLRVDEFLESDQRRESDCEWKPDWVDERVRVWSMAIAPTENGELGSLRSSESPLKRRYEDFVEQGSYAAVETDTEPNLASADSSAEDQRVRALVVAHMFDSAWRPDHFEEVPLAAVPVLVKIFTRDQVTQEIRPYSGPMPDGMNPVPQINVLVRKPWPGALIRQLPSTKSSKVAMSYIFRNHTQRGKFQPEKAKLLKVPPGPLWRELSEGRSVQSTDGQTVTPGMVLLDAREGSGFVVVDLPSPEYVQNLVDRPEWQAPAVINGVEMIIWILGPGVGQNEQLQNFICRHGNLRHIISSQDYCPNYISFDSGASGAIQLHQINPVQHPVPIHGNVALAQMGQSKHGQKPNIEFIQAKRGMKLILSPSVSFNREQFVPPLDTIGVLQKTPPDVLRLAMAARETIESASCQKEYLEQNLPSPEAEIIFLGTGSALPSKYRNVSGTLLRVPGSGSYLLDCGENTLGQLRRIYRPKQLCELLRDLKLIWISHLHADHHLGLPSVIKAWYEEVHGQKARNPQDPTALSTNHGAEPALWIPDKDSLIIVSSHKMNEFLREYSQVEDFGFRYLTRLRSIGATFNSPYTVLQHPDQNIDPTEITEALRTAGISDLQTCLVRHCEGAQAVSLTFPTGFKFSYSGDCRPSKTFAEIGKDSTVLLHEATFDDEMKDDAKAKNHSTTSEAIGVGVAMGARRILLTHFSQRYQKLPVISNVEGLDVKLEEKTDAGDEIDETDPDMALADSGSTELATSITQSLTSADYELATSGVGTKVPQTLPESNSVSVKQALPSDLKIGIAFDYMRVRVGDIIHLEKFTPTLLKLFEQQENEEQVGLQEEDLKEKNGQVGEGLLGAKNRKSRAEKNSGKKAEKKFINKAGMKAPRERSGDDDDDDGQAVPILTEGEGPIQLLPPTSDNISTLTEHEGSGKIPQHDQAIA